MDIKLGDKIRKKRKELGLTLKDIAGDIVTPSQISAIEKGKCKPSYDLLLHISKRLETDIEEFTLSEEEKHRKVFSLLENDCKSLIDLGKYDEALNTLSKSESLLGYLTYTQKGQFHYLRGECSYLQRRYSIAFDSYMNASGYFLKTKDTNINADTYVKIGNCLFNTYKPDIALGYYLKAYELILTGSNINLTAKILFNLCVCYTKLKRYDMCKRFLIELLCFLKNQEGIADSRLYSGIEMIGGVIYTHSIGFSGINKIFKKAFEDYKITMDLSGMGRAMHNKGMCKEFAGEYEDSIKCYQKAIEYKLECNDETLIDTYVKLINLYKHKGDFEKVIEVINDAEEKMIEKNLISQLIDVFIIKFDYYSFLEQYDRAEVFAFLALDNIEKIFDKRKELDIYIKLSEMYKRIGDNISSIEFVIKAKGLII